MIIYVKNVDMKICSKCGENKNIDDFYGKGYRVDNFCKKCRIEYQLIWQKNKRAEKQKEINSYHIQGKEKEILYTCQSCQLKLTRDNYSNYASGKRKLLCDYCVSMDIRDFNSWYSQNKDKKFVLDFLDNLRRVTGIYSPDDLIKKHRKFK